MLISDNIKYFHNFKVDIKKKENDLAKTKKKYDLERGLLEKNLSDVKFKNSEDKLKNEMYYLFIKHFKFCFE